MEMTEYSRMMSIVLLAAGVTIGLFLVMKVLVTGQEYEIEEELAAIGIDFVRVERDEESQNKDRALKRPSKVEPEEPPPPPKKRPSENVEGDTARRKKTQKKPPPAVITATEEGTFMLDHHPVANLPPWLARDIVQDLSGSGPPITDVSGLTCPQYTALHKELVARAEAL